MHHADYHHRVGSRQLLVYFGYPQAHEHDAEQAVRAGLALVDRIGRLESRAGTLATRVGIATVLSWSPGHKQHSKH